MDCTDILVIVLVVFVFVLAGSAWFGDQVSSPKKISFEGHEYICFRTFVIHNPDCKCIKESK